MLPLFSLVRERFFYSLQYLFIKTNEYDVHFVPVSPVEKNGNGKYRYLADGEKKSKE